MKQLILTLLFGTILGQGSNEVKEEPEQEIEKEDDDESILDFFHNKGGISKWTSINELD